MDDPRVVRGDERLGRLDRIPQRALDRRATPRSASTRFRSVPRTYSIAIHGVPSCSPVAVDAHDARVVDRRERRWLRASAARAWRRSPISAATILSDDGLDAASSRAR